MRCKQTSVFILAILVIGSALLLSCGTSPVAAGPVPMTRIYEQVRMDAARGRMDAAKANWTDTVMHANASETLSSELIQTIESHDILLTSLPCFSLPNELRSQAILDFCDSFCWMFYDMQFPGYPNPSTLYPAESISWQNYEAIFAMEKQTVEELASDFFDLQHFRLDESELLEWRDSMYETYPDFTDSLWSNIFCYIPHDPDPPALTYKSGRSLGDGFFYVVFAQAWYSDVEYPSTLQDLHVILRVADNFFGYEVVSILQNAEDSLL